MLTKSHLMLKKKWTSNFQAQKKETRMSNKNQV